MVNYLDLGKICFKNWLKYGQFAYDPNEYIVLHDRRLLVQIISKVACTSIKATIGKAIGINYQLPSGLDIHRNPKWHNLYGDQIKPYSNYKLICFVRNPLARLVSCYKQKVVFDPKNSEFDTYYFKDYPFSIKANESFSQFLSQVISIKDFAADRHFKSQHHSIFKNREPDFIGKLENIKQDWKYIAERYDFPEQLLRLNPNSNAKHLPDQWQTYYSDHDFDKAIKRFQIDINEFDYKQALIAK